MKESVAIAKEADRKKDISPTKSDSTIQRLRNEPERQLGSLRGVIDNIRHGGGTPSVESVATELSGMSTGGRAPALLALQRTHGNRYVQRVVAGIQAKLKVGQPGDKYEQEADRVADAVMRMPELVHKKCPECEDEVRRQPENLQATEISGSTLEVAPELESRINSMKGSGKSLPESILAFYEPRFGHDFSDVRVHADTQAADSSRALNARAYTVGHDIVFGAGQYAPGTTAGKRLIAHELVHVVQQGHNNLIPDRSLPIGQADDAHKICAIRAADFVMTSSDRISIGSTPVQLSVQRADELLDDILRGPFWERARSYEPPLRPHVGTAPPIPPPSTPQVLPGTCPDTEIVREEIRTNNIANETESRMRYIINRERARAALHQPFQLTQTLVQQSDEAIRNEFGNLLPSGRNFASPRTITVRTPAQLARLRIPDDQTARQRIAETAIQTSPDILRNLCATEPSQPSYSLLISEVATPLLSRLGIDFIRRYESIRLGGYTSHTYSGGSYSRHVVIPDEHRHIGHILVHEAMHYYVNDRYFATASGHTLEEQLIEGGAEFLARHAIHQRFAGNPSFRINYGTYSSEFRYVRDNLLRGGLSSFALAYFQGRVDLLGLTPRTTPISASRTESIQTKLCVGQSGDKYEQEANRVADLVMHMPEHQVQREPEEEEEPLAKELSAQTFEVTSELEARINAIRSGGQPLSASTRAFFEPRFRHDFSGVRVHTDSQAAQSAQAVHADGYTVGRHIVFGAGQYAPESTTGKKLLAHELTHVVQQRWIGEQFQRDVSPRIPTPREAAEQWLARERLRRILARYLPARQLYADFQRELRSVMAERDIGRITFPIECEGDFLEQVYRLEIRLHMGQETPGERIEEMLTRPPTELAAPSVPRILPEWLSLYRDGRTGFFVELSFGPEIGEEPLAAQLTVHFRNRGLPISSDLLTQLVTNYETGVRQLERLLSSLLPTEIPAGGAARLIAEHLLDASIEACVRTERPTPVEHAEEAAERIQAILPGEEASRVLGPLSDLVNDLGAGISITIRWR